MSDDNLRAEFDALRKRDIEESPDFPALWRRAKSLADRPAREASSMGRWVAIAASVVTAALLLFGSGRQPGSRRDMQLAAPPITSWRSPTAALLPPPSQSLLSSASVLSSVLDGVAPTKWAVDLE